MACVFVDICGVGFNKSVAVLVTRKLKIRELDWGRP